MNFLRFLLNLPEQIMTMQDTMNTLVTAQQADNLAISTALDDLSKR